MNVENQPENPYSAKRQAIEQKRRSFPLEKAVLRYSNHPPSRQTYHEFVWNHVGDLEKEHGLAADPAIIEGGFSIRALAKYTYEGNFIVVRQRPVKRTRPSDYYVVRASLRTNDTQRFYVTDHTNDGKQEVYLLSPSPDQPEPSEVAPLNSGNPWQDILDEGDIRDMYADRHAEQPRIVLCNGSSYYRESGVRHDNFMGDIWLFEERLREFSEYFGELAVNQSQHQSETAMIAG